MTMSLSMRNVRMHYYTVATAASVLRFTLEVLVTWISHFTFCGPTCGGKWPTDALTREVHMLEEQLKFSQMLRESSRWYGVFFLAANLVWYWVITSNTSGDTFEVAIRDQMLQFVAKKSENLGFLKILKFSFSEFPKNRFDHFSKSI